MRLADGQQVRAAQRAQSAPLVLRFEDVAAPVEGMLTAVEKVIAADETRDAHADAAPRLPPPPANHPPPPREPLSRAGAPPPVPVTVRVAEIPAQAPTHTPTPAPAPTRRTLVAVIAVVALAGALAAAALGAWWFLGSRRASTPAGAAPVDKSAVAPTAARQPAAVSGAGPAATAVRAPAEVLVVPVEADTGAAVVDVGARPAAPATSRLNPLDGKWTARLENVFYPEGDYAVELLLDLRQRGTQVTGTGEVRIENRSMTFGVPAASAGGTVQGGPPSQVRLRLGFGRPIGELQLEGTLDGDALAGTFRSSTATQAGAWQAVRAPG